MQEQQGGVQFAPPSSNTYTQQSLTTDDVIAATGNNGGAGGATHLSLPQPQTEEQLRRALGSASAPASPGLGPGHDAFIQPHHQNGTSGLPSNATNDNVPLHALSPAIPLGDANVHPQNGMQRSSSGDAILEQASTSFNNNNKAYNDGLVMSNHPDPAVAAGLLDPSQSEPAGLVPPSLEARAAAATVGGGGAGTGTSGITTSTGEVLPKSLSSAPTTVTQQQQQQGAHRHRHRHNNQVSAYGGPLSSGGGGYYNNPYPQQQQGHRGHQASHHSKPVFSLARPLPTREERDFQKAYREGIKNRTGAGKSAHSSSAHHHHHHQHHHQQHGPPIGPGGRHQPIFPTATAQYPYALNQHQHSVMGPGALHPAGPIGGTNLEPGFATGRPFGEGEQIIAMLRQILDANKLDSNKQQDGKDDDEETGTKVGTDDNDEKKRHSHHHNHSKDVRVDDPDSAMRRKEKFGSDGAEGGKRRSSNGDNTTSNNDKEKATQRAERSDSLSSGSSSSSDSDEDDEEDFPNPFARFRHAMREPFAEFLGTMLLVMFGTGVSLQYFLSLDPNVVSSPRGTYLSVSFGWGIGVGMGVWVAGGISGGHLNPAVTLALAVFRGFPWKKLPGYVLAQILGSMTGAGLNYAMYRRAISIFEGGGNIRTVSGDTATAGLFSTYPLEYLTDANAFFSEFINTAVLIIVVLAISDSNNAAPPDGLNPLVLMFLVIGIGASFGMQTAYCINPARDLGPRLVTWFAGYSTEVWNFRNQYWLWVPWLATLSGGLMGALIYDTLIYTGSESPCNMKWDWPWRNRKRASFAPATKDKAPIGQDEA